MEVRNRALDFLILPPLVLAHCIAVFLLLCALTAAWMLVFSSLHIEGGHTTLLLMGFVVPVIVAGVAAWFSFKFILDKAARTDTGRQISGAAVMLFAVTPPFYMFFVLLFVGCAVQQWTEGRCVML